MPLQLPEIFDPLSTLFDAMDRAWDDIAAHYGFQCTGCQDNCCHSLFFHHTHVEKAYLSFGFNLLDEPERQKILVRAQAYCDTTFAALNPVSLKVPCPLLMNGRCGIYTFRPMICRMHGLPHEIHRPGHPPLKGPGCAAGDFDNHPYAPFDRTPFYRDMAAVEMKFRQEQGKTGKIKETVAQILLDSSTSAV
jgi:Fe-S-cluster containining protein